MRAASSITEAPRRRKSPPEIRFMAFAARGLERKRLAQAARKLYHKWITSTETPKIPMRSDAWEA